MIRIKDYTWAITLALTLLGWVWVAAGERTQFRQQLAELDRRVTLLQNHQDTTANKLARIENALVQVQTDVRWIRQSLDQRGEKSGATP